ncbi:ATP-binding protein [Candidatus Rariloculus sp.]|uniref:ATP-binding protein n=1 Tax=Candidatus Rariloculus sp. TaxID=3101265 RepID=UPI003D0FB4DA
MKNWLQRVLSATSRISVRLYLGIGGAVALTLTTSLIAWFSFTQVGDSQGRINEYVPDMVTAFLLAQQNNSLAAAASRLTAAVTREEFLRVSNEIAEERALFEQRLNELTLQNESDDGANDIRTGAETLIDNIQAIERSVAESFTLSERSELLSVELTALQQLLERQLAEAIDDQFFYTVTGYRDLDQPAVAPEVHFTETEMHHLRYLMELDFASTFGTQILASVFSISDPSQLEPLRERFEAAAATIDRNLASIVDRSVQSPELQADFARLIEVGLDADGSFDLRSRELALAERQQELLTTNRGLAADLGVQIESNVSGARARSLGATLEATEATDSARNLLLWINVLAIAGALAIAWLYVGTLVGRIKWLSNRMRGMAAGELEAKVEMSGRDEVAEMAAALEVFRHNSLEAQRLNLVEKLAEELRGKNDQLEKVLGELRQAQDQIVMREKLAALGELTAGVAHEIKNPLNFVKNFAEGSVEMLDELKEVIAETDRELTDDQRQLIQEIGGDLNENLATILRNSERANRIVHDMLSMGRGSGESQLIDINALLMEHLNLAYHSVRATDPNFLLTIKEDLDPNAGELEVIPHDLGRVFLNMVSNACHATDFKRRKIEEETGTKIKAAGDGYEPMLSVSTRRKPDSFTVTIRDNGCGMPAEVVDKIFNPFFTTKPPNKGTGLGLSLSNDIVAEHGGSIQVKTEDGEYTVMSIELPLKPPLKPRPDDSEA